MEIKDVIHQKFWIKPWNQELSGVYRGQYSLQEGASLSLRLTGSVCTSIFIF
jgi:hypothetical protein